MEVINKDLPTQLTGPNPDEDLMTPAINSALAALTFVMDTGAPQERLEAVGKMIDLLGTMGGLTLGGIR